MSKQVATNLFTPTVCRSSKNSEGQSKQWLVLEDSMQSNVRLQGPHKSNLLSTQENEKCPQSLLNTTF